MAKSAYKEDLKRFGKHLKKLREERSLSLRELSYACNIDNSKISKIEKGKINITFTTIVQLAEALEIPLNELVTFES